MVLLGTAGTNPILSNFDFNLSKEVQSVLLLFPESFFLVSELLLEERMCGLLQPLLNRNVIFTLHLRTDPAKLSYHRLAVRPSEVSLKHLVIEAEPLIVTAQTCRGQNKTRV